MKDNQKSYAVIINGQVGKYTCPADSTDVRRVVELLNTAAKSGSHVQLSAVNPGNFRTIPDSAMVVFPQAGMVINVIPWAHFAEEQKAMRQAQQRQRQQSAIAVPMPGVGPNIIPLKP